MNKNILILLVLLLFNFGYGQTNTWTGAVNTAWENDLNWSLGVAPQALEDVVIPPVVNQPVISTAGVSCTTLTLGAESSITISASGTLAVIGEITLTAPTFDNGITTLKVGSGTLAAGGITMEAGVNDTRKCHLTIDTGTANVAGNVNMTGSALQNNIAFTSIGSLNIGGTMTGGSLTPDIGEVNYNGSAAQVVGDYVYDNLTLSGSGIKTFDSAIAVNNTLSIEAGVVADLGTFIHSTFLLSLNGSNSTGTWGGVGSAAGNISPTFFAANSGIVNVGPPTVQASNLVFTNTTSTSTTINWTNGNGASRVVFVHAGASGSASPLNYFPYTANSVFGLGTEIGSSGWFCVYKGTGTTLHITGLSPSSTYQVMTLEYNGSLGNELHLTATSTINPAVLATNTLTAVDPGGISGSVIWYKANAGITLNATNVSQWNDSSGNTNTAIQATAANQPAYTTNGLNFNQILTFPDSKYLTTAVNNLPAGNSARSVFIVASATGVLTTGWVYGYGTGSPAKAFNIGKISASTNLYTSGYSVDAQSASSFWTANVPKLGTVTYNSTTVSFFDAGNSIGTPTQTGWNTTLIANGGRIGSFVNGSNELWKGTIAEIIMYPSVLSAADALKIESYLAIKYGIHKSGNYVSSNDIVLWDATANATYHNDIFGLGEDDLSGLNQSISNSTNTGSGDGTGQSGKGNIIINNPSSLANNTFLIIGHNTSALTETNVVVGGNPTKRVQRIWKVQTTGNPGTIKLSYDISGLTYSAQEANDYVLLVDPTGTGDFSGGSVVPYTGVTLSGNKVTFDNVNLPTGAVFTFQTLAQPTIQATNVTFSNTTGTSTTASWTNGDGTYRAVFMYAGISGSPVPANNTTYTANTTFGSGTQIGTTGWYCVYNGTGTTVNIKGLTAATTYQLMVVEYTGVPGSELYNTAVSTGNPFSVTTPPILTPGGVSGIVLWLKANSGVLNTGGTQATDGQTVTTWTDVSGSRVNNATQATEAAKPIFRSNSTDNINFNPALYFDGNDDLLDFGTDYVTSSGTGSQNGMTWFGLVKPNNLTATDVRFVFDEGAFSGTGFGLAYRDIRFDYYTPTTFGGVYISNKPNTRGTKETLLRYSIVFGSSASVTFDGAISPISTTPISTTNLTGATLSLSSTHGGGGGGPMTIGGQSKSNPSGRNFSGKIGEVVAYSKVLTAIEQQKVESYLAIKYGITLGDTTNPVSYISSGGTTFWDATANTAYHNDVFGIGQDDGSALLQASSNSVNTGSGDGTGQSGKGNVVITNPSSLVNNGFLMIGHNASALTETDVTLGGITTKIVQRIWKAQSTGNPGNITLSFDKTGLTYGGQTVGDYTLLVDPTGAGDFNGGSVVKYAAASLTGNKLSFNAVVLPTGSVFTFQTLAQPTVQATNVTFSNTTGTSTTASWTNGDGTTRAVFAYAGASGSPVPVDNITYTANAAFGTGTQIGTTGWYSIYNGTGTTVDITGLTPGTTYQFMTVEYNGPLGSELYLTTVSTGNPGNVTTLNNIATLSNLVISEGTLTPVFATGTTSYTAKVSNVVNSLTVTPTPTDTNATITVNGLTVPNGSASDPITLTVGPNVITTIVTAQDGTTIETYTVTVTRAPAPPIITSFSPEIGPIGTTVIINGENFGATIAENTVYFGAVKATIMSASATSLTVTVPVGATYFPITVLNNTTVLSANSGAPFILNFAPNKGNITTDDFMPRVNFAEIGSVEELVVGDFDGDGKSDLALTLPHLDQLTFLRNTAVSGTIDAVSFTAAGTYTLDDYPVGISVADIDGDGKLDIVAANYHISTISILRNTSSGVGNISFAPQIIYNSGLDPYRLAIGDIDGDGKLDIATANKTGNSVSVFRNLSPGIGVISFDTRIDYTVGNSPYGIVIGDIDRDNKIDIITASANTTNPISVLRNISTNGAINFEPQVNFSTSFSAYDVAIGDLNKDGKADLAVANGNGNFVSILTNTSSGIGNINFAAHIDFPTNGIINNVAFSDLDGDGNLDLAVCDNANDLSVFRNTSTVGGAISFANRVNFVNQHNANSVVVGDFDGDGLNDMATANYESNNNISVFRNNPLFAPTVQATNVTFSNTTGTTTTISWTTGNGSSRAVFMYAGASGSTPLPLNFTTYTANAAFATGTQVGTSGWYCIYNGTDATASVTALTPATEYQVMVVEYNGSIPGNEMYQTATSTGNPAAVTTPNNIATLSNLSISEGTLDPVFDTATTSYIATVPNAVTSLTVTPTTTDTNATVTVNGLTVADGSASDPITLTVGPNVITTIVTAQDGTTIETYTITVTRTEPTIVTTGTLSALTTIYGTPSVSGTFNVSGSDMAEGILITAPTGFEVSSDDLTFTNSITVGAAGIIASTPVYIRLKGTVPAGTYSGDIVLTSTNAATVNVAMVSSTVTPAALTITADDKTKMYGDDNPTLTLSYSGFVNGDTVGSLTLAPITSTAAVTGSPVGDYTISVSGAANPNYTITYVDGTLTITKALLTITADDKTKVYGTANPTLTASYLGFVNGDTSSSLITQPTITTTALDASPVGTYTITASGAVSDNYDFTYVNGNLTITKSLLTITADDKTKVYGAANPTLTASYSGFLNGDTSASLTTLPTISTTALDASPVGTYTITASGAVSDNYDFTYVNGNLIITKALLTITADDQTKVYGTANPSLTASYSGFVNGDTSASLTTAPTISTTALDASPVGTYTITASGAVSDNYDFTYVNGNLTITKALLTITADDKTKIYGEVNPALTASYSGFVNADTATNLTTPPTITTTALDASPVGTYTITASGAVSDNYDFTYVNGTLTITKATLTITADDKTKVYGAVNPTLTASYSGFVNGDTATNLITAPTITTTALDASPVGTYTITASGAVSDNYDFSYVNGNLTITKALLTITADDQTKVYGTANPALTASYLGFVNGDTATNLITPPTISTTALDASPVGTYTITASGAVSDNYDFTYVNGNLTITKALLTITADDKTKVYGTANPTLTASYSGFANGDTSASLTTLPTITTIADATSPVGTYTITASGAVSDNYDFTYVNGTLTITKALLTITADDKTKVYGEANPTLTASYSGFLNGDTSASLTTLPTISTTALDASPVGTYTITASGAVSDNYDFTYVNGNFTITKALLIITADDKTKVYGTANPTLTASYSGFVNGDTATNLITAPTISTTALDASPVGTYTITASGAVSDNYDFTYVNGNLTITKATLTITADDKTKVYGSANPSLTASYSGFVNGETSASLTTLPTITTIADATSPVGTYIITASGAISDNYDFTYVNGNLTITKATLTITADDQTKVYGEVNPTLTASYLGFVNGDTSASLTTLPTISTIADDTSPVGTYAITVSGASSDNYTINYVDGTLTITGATLLTIIANNQSKIYGEANPILTVSYVGFVNGDTEASLTTLPTITTTAVQSSPVGTYPITASGAVNPNYTISYVPGVLTVTPANLAIAADDKTKIYGEANPPLTINYTGFVNGDTEVSLLTPAIASTTADATSPVGSYPITISGATSLNYTIGYTSGATLTVTPANLAIAADDKFKIYGEANPPLTLNYTGFVNGDTEASLLTPAIASTTADATSPVGSYPITISGATSLNYTIGYTSGATLTVTPANLAIAADDKFKIYGEANPPLTINYTGFVNGDTEASLLTPAIASTTADAASSVGSYPITISGATSLNYTIGYTSGATLTVTPANLTVKADNQTKTYGSVNPTLTASYSGFVNGDTAASFTTLPTISTIADATSPVGIYPITASGAVNPNYAINYVDGTLTITTATLTITADNQSKTYGSLNPTFTASYSGFVNGDTASSFITLPTISTTAVTGSNVGTYPITASGAVNPNYSINYVDGTLTITTATLTITADNQTKTYGSVNPTLTATYSGFVNGDTAASFTTLPTISTIADATSPVGSYPITASGAVNPNYAINYIDGTLTVTSATLTITADNQSKTYGSINPTFTASYSGFVNGDTAASFTTLPTVSTTAVTGSNVGIYPITASGAVNPNYAITYVDGTLTVTSATLTITADNQSKTYGSINPTFTASYSGFVNGDTAASFTTLPTVSTTAVTGSNVGIYPITLSGAVNPNYVITYVDGTLTVTTASLTITADNKTRDYGAPNPVLTASYSGFVNGDTSASLTTQPIIATIANATSPVGVYAITVSGAVGANYNITYVTGVLTIVAPTDLNLASLTVNNGTLNPAFSPNVLSYTVNVASTISSETITAIADDPLAKITINGITVQSGSPYTIALVPGQNTVVIRVVGEDGITTKSYTLNIIREKSGIATLSNLTISEGTLNPVFESDINNYSAVVKYDVASINVRPTATDLGSKITVNGLPVSSGTFSAPVTLIAGENIIETIVTAQDGITKETYTIIVYKGISPDQLVVNNILSPNGDGKNDFWVIKDIELFPNNTVTVYDRAGRIVYSKKSYSNEWDGSYSGSPLNNDTYYYLIDLGDNLPKIKGFITMLRD